MKILLVTDHPLLTTGYSIIGERLAKHLHSNGHEIEYIGWQGQNIPEERDAEVPYKIHRADMMRDRYGSSIFPGIIERFQPDVVWSTGDIWMTFHIPLFEGSDSYQSIWYAPIDSEGMLDEIKSVPNSPNVRVKTALEKFSIIVGQTKFACDVANDQLRKDKAKHVIYPGYDNENIFRLDDESRRKTRAMLLGDPDQFSVIFVSRNGIRKNPIGAMEAFLKADVPNSVMYMHCPLLEDMGYDLVRAARKFGSKNRIILSDVRPGHGLSRKTMNGIFNSGDVHLLISAREGFGITYLEAAAVGVPSIYTDANCIKEFGKRIGIGIPPVAHTWDIWTHSINQIVSSDQAAEAIRYMAEHPEERAKFKDTCLEFASEHTWEKFYQQWDQVFSEVETKKNIPFVNLLEKRKKRYPMIIPKKKETIALFSTWNERCGIARYSKNLAKNLMEKDFPFEHIKPIILVPDTSNFDDNYTVLKCWRRREDNLSGLHSVLTSIRPTVFHMQMDWAFIFHNLGFYVPLLAQLTKSGIKVIITYHTVPTSTEDIYGKMYADKIVELLRYSYGIFHSEYHMNAITEYAPEFKDKCFFIPHGVEVFDSKKPKNEEFTFISSGFAHLSKGFQHCIKASKLCEFPHKMIIQTSAHPLDPNQRDYLRTLQESAKDSPKIEIIDKYLEDQEISEMFHMAHLGVFMYDTLPSQGFSGSASTCLGAGTPIITSKSPAFDVMKDFPQIDSSAKILAAEMKRLFDNPEELKKLSEQTRIYSSKNSWKETARQHLELYRSLK